MSRSGIGVHLAYWVLLGTLLAGVWGLNQARLDARAQLQAAETMRTRRMERTLADLCAQLTDDLLGAAEAESGRMSRDKLTDIQSAAGQALLILSDEEQGSPWISFWQSLRQYAHERAEALPTGTVGKEDRTRLTDLAKLTLWLADHPSVLLDESTQSLPEGLILPTLQTAYAVEEGKTRRIAEEALGVRGGLRAVKNPPPGLRSYRCTNAGVDVLQSGQLIYLTLTLPEKSGDIGAAEAAVQLEAFARTAGIGRCLVAELSKEGAYYRGRLAPLRRTEAGTIPDLDRTVEIACTAWSGRICYFAAGEYYAPVHYTPPVQETPSVDLELLAHRRGAEIGAAFYYRGRICRPLIYGSRGFAGQTVLCVDALTGREVDLFYASSNNGERVLF